MAKADSDLLAPAKVAKILKLAELARERLEQSDACLAEIETLLSGGEGIGAKMTRLEETFREVWHGRYQPQVYVITDYAKVRAHWKRLLKILSVADIEGRMLRYLLSDEPFYLKARHGLSVFIQSINAHAEAATARPIDGVASGCRHSPVCASDAAHTTRYLAEMQDTSDGRD